MLTALPGRSVTLHQVVNAWHKEQLQSPAAAAGFYIFTLRALITTAPAAREEQKSSKM